MPLCMGTAEILVASSTSAKPAEGNSGLASCVLHCALLYFPY